MIITILVFLVVLTILVLIHEFGHFFVARKLDIKVEEFGFGLPPRAFGIKKGETIYSINWLPIGGFVKLYGEDEAGAGRISVQSAKSQTRSFDMKRAFFAKSVGERASVIVAGVVMNAVLAVVIFYTFLLLSNFRTTLPCIGNQTFYFVHAQSHCNVLITDISKNSPADKAGIQPNSLVLSVNGGSVSDTGNFQGIVAEHKGKAMLIQLENEKTKKTYSVTVTPRVSPPPNQGALGVVLSSESSIDLSYDTFLQKIFSGFIHPFNLLLFQFNAIGSLIHDSVQTKTFAPVAKNISGPVGIAVLVNLILKIPSFKEVILQLLNFAGFLSLSLAFFNVLPIPGLDGGRLFFILLEAATRRKVSPHIEEYINTAGMALLLLLIVLITYKDLIQFHILPRLTP